MIVLGSYPIQKLLGRKSTDLDLLATLPEFQSYVGAGNRPHILDKNHAFFKGDKIYDCELIWPDTLSMELAELILSDDFTYYDEELKAWVPSLDILYMLKITHRFKKNSPHFLKTMRDIQRMREAGAAIQINHMKFYKKRLAETLAYEHPNLNRTKDEFFRPEDDFYVYDHDSIHETVAIYMTGPAYRKYSVDGTEVLSSKDRFFETTNSIRLAGVYEEACVLALERSQIPNDFKIARKRSFEMALMKVCTSITSGWFREFAWENYDTVMLMYNNMTYQDRNYIDEFKKRSHLLRPYERKAA